MRLRKGGGRNLRGGDKGSSGDHIGLERGFAAIMRKGVAAVHRPRGSER
jgi:hypothetical protein